MLLGAQAGGGIAEGHRAGAARRAPRSCRRAPSVRRARHRAPRRPDNNACNTCQAATRAGGVIEAVVRLPYEGGPAGNSVSPICTAICVGPQARAPRRRPGPAPCRCRCRCPARSRTASTEPSRSTRTSNEALVCTLAPHSDCAMPMPRLIGPVSAPGAWRRYQPIRSAPMRRSSRRTGLGSMRSRNASGSIAELIGELVDRLSSPQAPGVLPGPRIALPRPGIDEHVVLRGREIRAS